MKHLTTITLLTMAVLGLACQNVDAQAKRALLVGISDYGNATEDPDKWANISGANDARLLSPLLTEQGFDVTSLVDAEATHNGIVASLKNLTKACQKGDVVYLHFSMHGQPFEDLDGDEDDGWDEALIPVDAQMVFAAGVYEGKNHLLDDELGAYCNDIRSKIGPHGKLYVVLDACHSGTSSRGDDEHVRGTREGFTRSGKNYAPDMTVETNDYFEVKTARGQSPVILLEACRSYQVNKEVRDVDTNTWFGSLSYYITQAIKGGTFDATDAWIDSVRDGMTKNRRLRKQNLVIEKSE